MVGKSFFHINFNTADIVNDFFERLKIHSDIIGDLNIKSILHYFRGKNRSGAFLFRFAISISMIYFLQSVAGYFHT